MATFISRTSAYNSTVTGTYVDVDFSSDIPAGASAIILEVDRNATHYSFSLRPNGSTDDHFSNLTQNSHGYAIIPCDSNRIIEMKQEKSSMVDLYAIGYLEGEFTGFSNTVDATPPSPVGYYDITLSSATSPDTAIGFAAESWYTVTGHAVEEIYIRANGSTDDKDRGCGRRNWWVTGCDGNQIIETRTDLAGDRFGIQGYWTEAATFYTNMTDESASNTLGSYTDMDTTLSGTSVGGIYEMYRAGGLSSAMDIRSKGDTYSNIKNPFNNYSMGVAAKGTDNTAEYYKTQTAHEFNLKAELEEYTMSGGGVDRTQVIKHG